MKKFLFMAVTLLIALGACRKEKEDISPVQKQDMTVVDNQSSLNTDSVDDIGNLKISSSTILNATSASQIPSQMFAVNPIYKTAYYHYKQPDGVSCSWTSYVNCINCIVTANHNYCYPTPISTVRSRCTNYYPQVVLNGANSILALEWHVGKYDKSYVYYLRPYTTTRWLATVNMLAHINSYHTPFVVRSSMNGVGHFRVVFSIDWKQSETNSTVYYTDCYPTQSNGTSFQTNLHSMNLYDFLNLMKTNATTWNMLFMWPK